MDQMPKISHRRYNTRNNEFLKYVSAGAGLGQIKHCVLDGSLFPVLPVHEGYVRGKRLARKGQVIVRDPDTELWGPFQQAVSTVETMSAEEDTLHVYDASVFEEEDEVGIQYVDGPREIASIDLEANTITFTEPLGVVVPAGATISSGTTATGYDDMAVLGDEFDFTYNDRLAGPGYHLNCFFNTDNLIGYAGNETAVQEGLPTCFFERLPDVTDV
jgi:hypothetical protein